MSRPDITLYTAQTPNGIKISITLEELGYDLSRPTTPDPVVCTRQTELISAYRLPYKFEKIDLGKNTQKEEYVLSPGGI